MKHYTQATVPAIVLAIAALCATGAAAQDARIAVVDVQFLTLGSDEGRALGEQLQKKYDEFAAELQKISRDIEEKQTRLKTQERVMSETVKAQLSREILTDQTSLQRKNEDYQKEFGALQDQMLAPLAQKAQAMLAAYVAEKSFALLIDLSAENGNVVWWNPANDITADVIKRLNEEYKKTASSAPAKPAQ